MAKSAKFFLITLFSVAILAVCFIPAADVSFAEESAEEFSFVYVFEGEEIYSAVVPKGTKISALVSYSALPVGTDVCGKKIVCKYEDTGNEVVVPFTVENNVRITVSLVDTEETVTFSYYYGYGENDKEDVIYKVGAQTSVPTVVHGASVSQGKFYTDKKFSVYASVPRLATEDFSCYPLLDKAVTVTFNGEKNSFRYGSPVSSLDTPTHAARNVSLDEGKTKKFDSVFLGDVVLYGDMVRTHYSVTFDDGSGTHNILLPVDNPVLTEDRLPKTAVEWRFDEAKRVTYPLTVSDDIVLYSSNGMNNPLTDTDRILLYVAGAILLAMAIWGAVYEHMKTVKKRKLEQSEKEEKSLSDKRRNEDVPPSAAEENAPENSDSSQNTETGE